MANSDEVDLIRTEYKSDGTFGMMYFRNDIICCTCELPWENNQPDVSCIPLNKYWVEPYSSQTHPNVWHVMNVPNRSGILIHNGNTEADSKGCIVVGDSFGQLGGFDAVLNSKATIEKLRTILPLDGFWLNIKSGDVND